VKEKEKNIKNNFVVSALVLGKDKKLRQKINKKNIEERTRRKIKNN